MRRPTPNTARPDGLVVTPRKAGHADSSVDSVSDTSSHGHPAARMSTSAFSACRCTDGPQRTTTFDRGDRPPSVASPPRPTTSLIDKYLHRPAATSRGHDNSVRAATRQRTGPDEAAVTTAAWASSVPAVAARPFPAAAATVHAAPSASRLPPAPRPHTATTGYRAARATPRGPELFPEYAARHTTAGHTGTHRSRAPLGSDSVVRGERSGVRSGLAAVRDAMATAERRAWAARLFHMVDDGEDAGRWAVLKAERVASLELLCGLEAAIRTCIVQDARAASAQLHGRCSEWAAAMVEQQRLCASTFADETAGRRAIRAEEAAEVWSLLRHRVVLRHAVSRSALVVLEAQRRLVLCNAARQHTLVVAELTAHRGVQHEEERGRMVLAALCSMSRVATAAGLKRLEELRQQCATEAAVLRIDGALRHCALGEREARTALSRAEVCGWATVALVRCELHEAAAREMLQDGMRKWWAAAGSAQGGALATVDEHDHRAGLLRAEKAAFDVLRLEALAHQEAVLRQELIQLAADEFKHSVVHPAQRGRCLGLSTDDRWVILATEAREWALLIRAECDAKEAVGREEISSGSAVAWSGLLASAARSAATAAECGPRRDAEQQEERGWVALSLLELYARCHAVGCASVTELRQAAAAEGLVLGLGAELRAVDEEAAAAEDPYELEQRIRERRQWADSFDQSWSDAAPPDDDAASSLWEVSKRSASGRQGCPSPLAVSKRRSTVTSLGSSRRLSTPAAASSRLRQRTPPATPKTPRAPKTPTQRAVEALWSPDPDGVGPLSPLSPSDPRRELALQVLALPRTARQEIVSAEWASRRALHADHLLAASVLQEAEGRRTIRAEWAAAFSTTVPQAAVALVEAAGVDLAQQRAVELLLLEESFRRGLLLADELVVLGATTQYLSSEGTEVEHSVRRALLFQAAVEVTRTELPAEEARAWWTLRRQELEAREIAVRRSLVVEPHGATITALAAQARVSSAAAVDAEEQRVRALIAEEWRATVLVLQRQELEDREAAARGCVEAAEEEDAAFEGTEWAAQWRAVQELLRLERLREEARLQGRPFVGFSLAEPEKVRDTFRPRRSTVTPLTVDSMYCGGPAFRAGMCVNDVLRTLGGVPVVSLDDVRLLLQKHSHVGGTVTVRVQRATDSPYAYTATPRDAHGDGDDAITEKELDGYGRAVVCPELQPPSPARPGTPRSRRSSIVARPPSPRAGQASAQPALQGAPVFVSEDPGSQIIELTLPVLTAQPQYRTLGALYFDTATAPRLEKHLDAPRGFTVLPPKGSTPPPSGRTSPAPPTRRDSLGADLPEPRPHLGGGSVSRRGSHVPLQLPVAPRAPGAAPNPNPNPGPGQGAPQGRSRRNSVVHFT